MAKSYQIFVWKRAPFIRLLPALIMGILAQQYLQIPVYNIFYTFIFVSCLLYFISIQKISRRFFHLPVTGFFLLLLICLSGMIITSTQQVKNEADWYGNAINEADGWEMQILSRPQEKEKTYKVAVEVRSKMQNGTIAGTRGRSILYLRKDSASASLLPGERIYIKNKLQPVESTGNPGSFDYAAFLATKGIYHQAFLSRDEWIKVQSKNHKNIFRDLLNATLAYENRIISTYIPGIPERALTKALLTGDRSDIDPDLVQAYANTGVVHIMAISGLHLGLIYLFLLQACKVIPALNRNKMIRMIFVLSGIWFFSFLTGASPSVLRAAVMFSFLSFGMVSKKRVSSYNYWAASAFILLVVNPALLWNVGFQLSYAAVLGILIAQRPIGNWFSFDNKIMDYSWQLISVSVAAQIFTFPLTLYYFHQLPILFIVANLVAIPLVSAGLWLGMVLVFIGWIPFLAKIVALPVFYIFKWLNASIEYISSLSYSVWEGFFTGVTETFLLLLFMSAVVYWLMNKEVRAFKIALFAILSLSVINAHNKWEIRNQQKLIAYNFPSSVYIDLYSGSQFIELKDVAPGQEKNTEKSVRISRAISGAIHHHRDPNIFIQNGNEFVGGRFPVLHVVRKTGFYPADKKMKLKAIILSHSPELSIAELNRAFDSDMYIFTTTNKKHLREKWKKECEDLNLRFQDLTTQGALVINF